MKKQDDTVPAQASALPGLLQPIDLDEAMQGGLPAKYVRSLSTPDLYFALRDVGEDTRQEVLALVLPEQMQGLFDLDIWDRDRINLTSLRAWFHSFVSAMPEGRAAVHLQNLDPELLASLLVSEFIVLPIGPDYEAEAPSDDADWSSPDGRFWLWRRTTPIGEQAEIGVKVLELLYREAPVLAQRLLIQASTGLFAEVEESAFAFRDSRLADMGFPSAEAANAIWQPIKADASKAAPEVPYGAPRYLAVEVSQRSRLKDRLAKLSPERQAAAATELVMLSNAALISEAVQMHDRASVERTLGMVAGFLDLGLTQSAGEQYLQTDLKALFQLGVGVVAPLSRRARALTKSHAFNRWGKPLALLDAGEAEFLSALARPHPLFADPRLPEGNVKGFATLDEVNLAHQALARLETAVVFLFGEKGIAIGSAAWDDQELFPPRDERTIHTLVGTFLARLVLKATPSVEPVTSAEVRSLVKSVEALADFRAGLAKLAPAETPLGEWLSDEADRWLQDIRDANGNAALVTKVLRYGS